MVSEMTMMTSMGFTELISLPMPTFCMIYRHAKKIKEDDTVRLLFELCDVVGVAYGGPNFQAGLKSHYRSLLLNEKQREKAKNPLLFDMSDKTQSDQAASIVAATLRKKAQLMGITVGQREQ